MTRLSNSVYLEEGVYWGASAPTADGRTLELVVPREGDPDASYKDGIMSYTYGLSALHSDPEDDFLVRDAVECRFWVPDDQGRVWMATSAVTADTLVSAFMAHSAFVSIPVPLADAPAEIREAFERPLLVEAIRYGDDSRMYEAYEVGGEVISLISKYSHFVFDIAAVDHDGSSVPYARMREGADYDPSVTVGDIEHTEGLPALVVGVSDLSQYAFQSGGIVLSPSGEWIARFIPRPLVFELTGERAEPQVCVRIVERSWLTL